MTFTTVDQSILGPYQNSAYTFLGMGRNRVINGDMVIDQQNAGTSVVVSTTATVYSVDTMAAQGQIAKGVFTLQQLQTIPPTNFTNYLHVAVTTADGSIAAGATYTLQNRIEGYCIRDFNWGTVNAKTVAVSFWARSSRTGTFSASLYQSAGSLNSYVFNYTINSANTWQYFTVTIPGPTSGTFDNTTGIGIRIFWDLGCGTSSETTAGSWQSGNFFRTAGSVKLIDTISSTLDVTGVQMELGTSSTPFEFRPYATELVMCQRYLETTYFGVVIGSASNNFYDSANAVQINTTTMRSQSMPFKVLKRAAPTVTLYSTSGVAGQWNWINTSGTNTVRSTSVTDAFPNHINIQQTTAVEYLAQGHWVADARL